MAVEVEGASQVEEFLSILRRRAWWIVIPTVILGTLGVAVAVIVPKKYVTTARVLVRDVAGLVHATPSGSVSRMEGMVAPYVVGSTERVTQVLTDLKWPDYLEVTGAEQHEYRRSMMDNLHIELQSAQSNMGAQIVAVRFAHTVPQRAYDFLFKLVTSWKDEVQSRFQDSERTRLETLKRTEERIEAERAVVSDTLETKKRENNIRPDFELDRRGLPNYTGTQWDELERLDTAIEADENRLRELELAIATAQKKFDEEPQTVRTSDALAVSSTVADRIKDLEDQKLRLQLELQQGRWTSRNSEWIERDKKIKAIDRLLDEARGFTSRGSRTPELEEYNPERAKLRDEIEEAQIELGTVTKSKGRNVKRRDELKGQLDILQRELNDIKYLEARFAELSAQIEDVGTERALQESQVAMIETDAGKFFEDLEAPHVPLIPTEPNPLLISVLALFLGLAIGLGLAVLSELSRATFRTPRDIARVMALPVLGTVNRIVTRRQRARLLFARGALAVGTLAFVCVIGYVTWAWAYDLESLSTPVRAVIDGLRQPFL